MKLIVLDSEGDNLAHHTTKLHNLCTTQDGENFFFTTDYEKMKEELLSADLLVCHNIHLHDRPAFKKVLGIDIPWEKCIDTLAISWALYADRQKHGLSSWGTDVGVEKVKVSDDQWSEGDYELMKSRVTEDVKINWLVWKKMDKRLDEIYGDYTQGKMKYLKYLSWKMEMLRIQQENPLTLDVKATEGYLKEFEGMKAEKVEALTKAMPKKPILKSKAKPKVMTKKDGSSSAAALKWYEFLEEQCLPEGTEGPVNYIDGYEEGNPNSSDQVKEWLYNLGWKPRTFKYTRNKVTGEEKKIEQVRKDGMLCESVLDLIDKDPAIELLDGLTVLTHRIGVLKGFLKAHEGGKVVASAGGLTNTLRMQHRAPVVNLPSVEAKFGEPCRKVLVAPEGKIMIGADVTSLEDSLKQHFIQPLDPDYVEEMNTEGYDPHVSLSVVAGVVSQEGYEHYVAGKISGVEDDLWKKVHKIRKPYKTVNYAAQYQIGKVTLARNTGMSEREAQALLDAYWTKNWAIKKVASQQYIKTLKDGSMWLKNLINGFYYSLRYERDTFSTLVQGSGDYVFCLWTLFCVQGGIIIHLNYHDEWLTSVDIGTEDKWVKVAEDAMKKVNEVLKLNKEITIGTDVGYSYAECH